MTEAPHSAGPSFSTATGTAMRFAVFVPPQALNGTKVPMVWFLSGLTCTEENFTVKAGAQRIAAQLGLMLVMPDTSPRGEDVPDDDNKAYDFGIGAGYADESKVAYLDVVAKFSSGLNNPVPNRHLFPIYQEIVTQSNGTISNSYQY